jgi:hypothetical protein
MREQPIERGCDVRAADLQEEMGGTVLSRFVSSDEDGGNPANIAASAASAASNQTLHRSTLLSWNCRVA